MWKVLFMFLVLTATCEPYTKKPKSTPNRNQRIIKVQGPPHHYNHFHGHQKPLRKRPFGGHHGEEFIRPNHPPPIPPFFNGPSTNHVKHLPRPPPPHVFHKIPSYGLGFPYKSFSSHRPLISKEKFRVQTITPIPLRGVSSFSNTGGSISSSTTFHSPTFTTSSSSFISSPMPHIISSDDNNGPIREIPAPNLAPKPHEGSYSSISVVSDLSGLGGISSVGGIGASGIGGVKIHGIGDVSGVGGILHGVSDGIHSISGIGGVRGVGVGSIHGTSGEGIHSVGGVGSIHGTSGEGIHSFGEVGSIHGTSGEGIHGGGEEADISSVAQVGGVTHLEPEALLHTVAKNPNGVNLDSIVKDQGLEVNTYIKESPGDIHHGKGPTVEIANFDEGSSIDVTNLIKDAPGSSDHHSSYEVTEHHNHLPSNDQIIKGHDGSKLYYAPDPDPSLPVHKVPPTNDPHSTPSNGQNPNNLYIPQITHGFPYLQGNPVGAPLSSQELFHLMHGYPAVISQPLVAFVSQPHPQPAIIPNGGSSYIQQNTGNYDSGHYTQEEHGNDIAKYLQQPEIHNLLHNQDQDHIGGSHSSVVNQYTQSESSLESTKTGNYQTDINHNYQYEPEASESNKNSLTVIRQTNEASGHQDDTRINELNIKETSESVPTILQLKNIPEVPFYASLPSQKAAETLATLQAAGSIASNYMNKIKIMRGDQNPEQRISKSEKTIVDIQPSVSLYETSISSKNLIENDEDDEEILESEADTEFRNLNIKEEVEDANETFGKRIRPK